MSKNKGFSNTSANRYSLALFELAEESNLLSKIETNSLSILNLIGTSVDFNNLIGAPVNRYRERYKDAFGRSCVEEAWRRKELEWVDLRIFGKSMCFSFLILLIIDIIFCASFNVQQLVNFLFIIFFILISCSKKDLKTEVVDINKKMTFEEFRVLIEKNGNIKGYPSLD